MPFKSKAQRKWMHAAEGRGEVTKGTAKRWEKHTKNPDSLPERASGRSRKKGGSSARKAALDTLVRARIKRYGKRT